MFWATRCGSAVAGAPSRPVSHHGEITRVFWWFISGAIVIGFAVLTLGYSAPLWLALPVAFVVGTAALLWYGRAYDRAAARVRKRLT